jgi:hypothetical protein
MRVCVYLFGQNPLCVKRKGRQRFRAERPFCVNLESILKLRFLVHFPNFSEL